MTPFIIPLSSLRPAALFTALAVSLVDAFAAKAPDTSTGVVPSTTRAPAIPLSVFDYRAGKDPFFPDRSPRPVSTVDSPKKEIPVLKGITGSADRRVALINDRTFMRGEAGEIRLGTNTCRIRLIDIKDRTVIIERDGQTNELPLAENLLPLDGRK